MSTEQYRNSSNISPIPPVLFELSYPNALRNEKDAATYASSDGDLYVQPLEDHDFDLTAALHDAGVASGEVVTIPEYGAMVKYSRNTDLLPLSSLLNASVNDPNSTSDITRALARTAQLFRNARQFGGISVESVQLDGIAIDRAADRAEPVAPYRRDPEYVAEEAELMARLEQEITQKCDTEVQRVTVQQCFADAVTLDLTK